MSDLKDALTRYVQEQTPGAPPPFDGVDVRARHRSHRRMATIAAVPLVLVAVVVGTQLASDPAPDTVSAQAPISSVPTAGRPIAATPNASPSSQQPVVPGASQGPGSSISSFSCVESYGLTSLKGRDFAFDGTVSGIAAIQPPQAETDARAGYLAVAFIVHEWFRGGDQATVSVDMMPGSMQGVTSFPAGANFGVGTRLLVSGEPRFGGGPLQAPVAWPCGFTRQFDQVTAVAWRQAFDKR